MPGECWPPFWFFVLHRAGFCLFAWLSTHTSFSDASLAAFCFLHAECCCLRVRLRLFWWLFSEVRLASAIPFWKTLRHIFTSSTSYSSCSLFLLYGIPKLFLWLWCCAEMLPCLLCHVLVPRDFTATPSGLPHLSLAKSSLARWPPQVTPSLFFMFPSLWASLVCSFMPSFSFSGISISIITYSQTLHSHLIILRLGNIRVQFECGGFASSNSASPCHLACLFFKMLNAGNNVSSVGNFSISV